MKGIWKGENIQELDRAMLLRVATRSNDLVIGAFLGGVLVGVVVASILTVVYQ